MANATSQPIEADTWEPTMRLRWARIPVQDDAMVATTSQLQQLWRCRETHETEWRAIEVEA